MFKKFLVVLAFLVSTAMAMAAVDVNKATEAELDSVKGIGPSTTKLITAERKKSEFKDWNDFITRVKGVGEKRATHLSEAGLTIGGKSYNPAAMTKSDDKKSTVARADAKAARTEAAADKKAMDAKVDAKATKAEAKADKKEAKADKTAAAASAAKK
ncbi:MAG: hypothetical protein NVS2B4_06470 [Ramlibacter sp.]